MPYGQTASPVEIAPAAAFLVSSRSGHADGSILVIDGGTCSSRGQAVEEPT